MVERNTDTIKFGGDHYLYIGYEDIFDAIITGLH